MLKQFNSTTYQQLVKDDPEDRLQVEVGDSKQPDFKPQFKLMRWDNEVNFSIRAEEKVGATMIEENRVVKYITSDYEVHQYDKPDASDEGGFEFEWVLNKKPISNVLQATVQSKGLRFTYQPALMQKKIDDGAERPENIVGSYAVYHSTKANHKIGDKNYKAGKAFHIYRPKVTDKNGDWIWGELDIAGNNLTITIDQAWLDKAVYPVIVDPTFGYTTAGGSTQSVTASQIHFDNATGVAGTGDSMSAYIKTDANGNGSNAQYHLYDASLNKVTNGITDENLSIGTTASWITLNFTASPTLTAQTYHLAAWSDASGGPGGNLFTHWDTSSGNDNWQEVTGVSYNTWPDPIAKDASNTDEIISIYATYTAGGGGSGPATLKTADTVAVASVKTMNGVAIASVKTVNTAV